MEFLAPLAGERILDAGCGTGVFTLDILEAGAHVAGVITPYLRWARQCVNAVPYPSAP
jgi:predicted RNA methylase